MSGMYLFWQQQLEQAKTQLVSIQTAITTLVSGAQEYRISTGQSEQTVKRADLDALRGQERELISRISTLSKNLGMSPTSSVVVPIF